jgi:glutamyl-tRNA synthetase
MILKALGADPPVYAHLPLLHGPDGKKLSKRHGAASVQELRDAGYLPEAVRNYIALLGWGLDASTTFMSTEELVRGFSLARVSRSPAVFDEQKLRWMNGRYLRGLSPADLAARLEALLGREGLEPAVQVAQEKMQTLADFWPLAGFLVESQPFQEKAWEKVMKDGALDRLAAVRAVLAELEPFDVEHVEEALRRVVDQFEVKPKEVFQPLRVAISGGTISPGIFESVVALGREETIARIDLALTLR